MSWTAVSITGWSVFQFAGVNVRLVGLGVRSVPACPLIVTVTSAEGAADSTTSIFLSDPSGTSTLSRTVSPAVSLSLIVTATVFVTLTYPPPLASSVKFTGSSTKSLSSAAVSVTCCTVFQLVDVKVRSSGLGGVASKSVPACPLTVTVTSPAPEGAADNRTENVLDCPSATSTDPGTITTGGKSASEFTKQISISIRRSNVDLS